MSAPLQFPDGLLQFFEIDAVLSLVNVYWESSISLSENEDSMQSFARIDTNQNVHVAQIPQMKQLLYSVDIRFKQVFLAAMSLSMVFSGIH